MDAMIKKIFLMQALCICLVTSYAQQMNWSRLTEDTIYYGKDYLPDHRMVTMTGPAREMLDDPKVRQAYLGEE